MPTKPNRAGEQQNYVPAGNGDASGEYGDNATGSNVHFTNFKKPRKVKKYWVYDDETKYSGRTVSESEYNYAESKRWWKEGMIKEIEEEDFDYSDLGKTEKEILDILEEGFKRSDFINNFSDLERTLKFTMNARGISSKYMYSILDGFEEEIKAKYKELIKPKIDIVNNINNENASEIFSKNIRGDLTDNFKNMINNVFNDSKDDDFKSILSAVSVSGLRFSDNVKKDMYGYELTTCYNPNNDTINILKEHYNDVDALYHEGFHAVYHRYNVDRTGLIQIMKEESESAKKAIEEYFKVENYAKNHGIENYPEKIKQYKKDKKRLDELWKQVISYPKGSPERIKALNEYDDLSNNVDYTIESIESKAKDYLSWRYPNLADMAHAVGAKGGFGHKKNYWKMPSEENDFKGEDVDGTNQSNEFFAEMSAIKATGDKDGEYDLIKQFFPNSVKKYEEIINNIINNKGAMFDL